MKYENIKRKVEKVEEEMGFWLEAIGTAAGTVISLAVLGCGASYAVKSIRKEGK